MKAKFEPINVNDEQAIQVLTDSMANNLQIQIEYQGSGWRTVLPYGWNSSKNGDILLMCYKSDGAIRSYRLDRIGQLFVDDSLLAPIEVEIEEQPQNSNNPEDYIIPYLPETEDILQESEQEQGAEQPFDSAIEMLQEEQKQNDMQQQMQTEQDVQELNNEEVQMNDNQYENEVIDNPFTSTEIEETH